MGSAWKPAGPGDPFWACTYLEWLLWHEFPLFLNWQFVNLEHMANVASLSTVITAAHLYLNLQNETFGGSEYPLL